MSPSHTLRSFMLKILLVGLVCNHFPHWRPRAITSTQEPPPIDYLLSEVAKLRSVTRENIICDWLRLLALVGQEREAFGWTRQIQDPALQSQALRAFSEMLFRIGKHDEAMRAVEAAYSATQRINPQEKSFGESSPRERAYELRQIARVLGQYGESEKARQLIAEAINLALNLEEPDRRYINLSQAVSQLACLGRPEEALVALRQIKEPSFRANTLHLTLTELIAAGAGVPALLEFRSVADDYRRLRTLQTTVNWLLKNGKWDEALNVAAAARDSSERVAILHAAAATLYRGDQADQARKILDLLLVEAREITDLEQRADALAGIAGVLAECGRLMEGRELIAESCKLTDEQISPGQHAATQHIIFSMLLAAGQGEEALALIPLSDEPDEHLDDLCVLIDFFIKTRQPARARQLVNEVLAAVGKIQDEEVRLSRLQTLIALLVKSPLVSERKRATEAAFSALRKGTSDNSFIARGIIRTLALGGQTIEALRFVAHISDPKDRSYALIYTAEELTKAGRKPDAQKMLTKAIDAVRQIDESMLRQLILTSLVRALIGNGQIEEALRVARIDPEGTYRSDCLRLVADALIRSGTPADLVDRWLEIVSEIEHEHAVTTALLSGLDMMIQADRFDDWLTLANTIEDRTTLAQLLCSSAEHLVQLGRGAEATQIMETTFRVLQQIEPSCNRSRISAEFAVKLAAWHNYLLAIETADLCTEPDDKLEVLTAILREGHVKQQPSLAQFLNQPLARAVRKPL